MKHDEYAVIDIGSNSLRLLKGWQETAGIWEFTPKILATTRLGRGMDETRHLSPEGMDASFQAMEDWKSLLQDVPVCAVATSAVREACDGKAFLAEIRARFGWHCRIISGIEEASLSFCGATVSAPQDKIVAVLDIGGGSSEVAAGTGGLVRWSHSYPMGAVRFTKNDMMTDQDIHELESRCLSIWLPMKVRPELLMGVGGTLTTLAAMDMGLTVYDSKRIEGCKVTLGQLSHHIKKLSRMTPEQRRHVPGLQPSRSDIIIAGLIIARSFLLNYGLNEFIVSEKDLMEGVFYRHSFHDAAWNSSAESEL
ncbi:MAG: Ppx/GppA family phosphatase [Megasphaera sp.]|jgi:exopolyphosphatase/guanosine-5'-triphosphate,3'-diphosphate pyrophosphatase|nr:Ppx/GppA family phosphatase [Megasphaera sp.]MCI1247500.1 Ppx/GppA family phosphatase [Megasphaera sp.]